MGASYARRGRGLRPLCAEQSPPAVTTGVTLAPLAVTRGASSDRHGAAAAGVIPSTGAAATRLRSAGHPCETPPAPRAGGEGDEQAHGRSYVRGQRVLLEFARANPSLH